jgi:hypothetical protein
MADSSSVLLSSRYTVLRLFGLRNIPLVDFICTHTLPVDDDDDDVSADAADSIDVLLR